MVVLRCQTIHIHIIPCQPAGTQMTDSHTNHQYRICWNINISYDIIKICMCGRRKNMYVIKSPVPTLEIMPIYYKNVSKSHRVRDSIGELLRCNDTVYSPKKPTKENIIDNYEHPFGESIFLAHLRNICSWQVVENGVFYVRYKEGLRYLHESGRSYKIDDNDTISDISYENGIIKVYAVKNIRQTKWNEHYDTYGGYDEEWWNYYEVEKQEISMVSYKEVLDRISPHEERVFAEQNNLPSVESESDIMSHLAFVGATSLATTKKMSMSLSPEKPLPEIKECTEVLNLLPLFYKKNLIGYRFVTDNGTFDMSEISAGKCGLDKSKVNMLDRIDLVRAFNFLFDSHEVVDWKSGRRFIYDISADEEDCKKLIKLLSN